MAFKFFVLLACVSVSFASAQLTGFNLDFNLGDNDKTVSTTPVPILRYIDTQNPDGSYTYGYESGDGSYKIETRYATGEVRGKYGYYDDTGVLREVEYGASKNGFEPVGSGLIVPEAPVAPVTPAPAPRAPVAPVNGRRMKVVRRRKPKTDRTNDPRTQLPSARRIINRNLPIDPRRPQPRQQPQQPAFPAFAPTHRPQQPAFVPRQQPQQPAFVPRQQPQQPAAPAFLPQSNSARFEGHPAVNIDMNTGSYTISYTG